MIAPEAVDMVKRLLKEEPLNQREIARRVGINRETVGIIARGQRPDYEALRQARAKRRPRKRGKTARLCPQCHALVYLPCVACETRREMAKPSAQRPFFGRLDGLDGPLGLDLKERHRQRYEEIRARRLRTLGAAAREEPAGAAVAGSGDRPRGLLGLLQAARQGPLARASTTTFAEKRIESCLAWCGLAMRPARRRRQGPPATVQSPPAQAKRMVEDRAGGRGAETLPVEVTLPDCCGRQPGDGSPSGSEGARAAAAQRAGSPWPENSR
jgi:transcriptional regulator with XRE-family HTH domain